MRRDWLIEQSRQPGEVAMPFYKPLKNESVEVRRRTVAGIQRLREQFALLKFPIKKASKSLILGTWNICT